MQKIQRIYGESPLDFSDPDLVRTKIYLVKLKESKEERRKEIFEIQDQIRSHLGENNELLAFSFLYLGYLVIGEDSADVENYFLQARKIANKINGTEENHLNKEIAFFLGLLYWNRNLWEKSKKGKVL